MQLSFIQILLLSIYPGFSGFDTASVGLDFACPLVGGFFAGLIVGNVPLGVTLGGTLTLMSLGLHTYGGASIPDYLISTVIATALATVTPGMAELPVEEAAALSLAFAVPLGLLLIQIDILRRTICVFWQQCGDRAHAARKYRQIVIFQYCGLATQMLARSLPTLVALLYGPPFVEAFAQNIPAWLTNGIRTAGGILPAMGFVILLNYLPLGKFYPFYILGFVMFAYGSRAGFNLIAISLLGFGAALLWVMIKKERGGAQATAALEVEIDE